MGRVNELLDIVPKHNTTKKDKEYKIKEMKDSAEYINVPAGAQLSGLYYIISWKNYPEDKSTWELALTVMQLWKMIGIFHKDY